MRAPPARMIAKEKVILRRVPEYNPALIEKVVTEGLAEFGLESRVHGRITIKPNVVMSHPKVTPSAYTRAEFLDGLLRSLGKTKCGDLEMVIAEKCGVGIPTSRMFRRAGYYQLKKNHPVRLVPIEEARKRTVALAQGITAAIKLNVGILCDRERMWNHNYNLDEVDCGIKVICGEPYCRGGCHGLFLDWLYMIKDRKPELWKNLPPWTVVIGKYAGEVDARKLMIIGTCSEIRGKAGVRKAKKIKGCPPKHKDLVLWFFLKARILNPLFRMDLIYDGYLCLFFTWCRRLLKGRS